MNIKKILEKLDKTITEEIMIKQIYMKDIILLGCLIGMSVCGNNDNTIGVILFGLVGMFIFFRYGKLS